MDNKPYPKPLKVSWGQWSRILNLSRAEYEEAKAKDAKEAMFRGGKGRD